MTTRVEKAGVGARGLVVIRVGMSGMGERMLTFISHSSGQVYCDLAGASCLASPGAAPQ